MSNSTGIKTPFENLDLPHALNKLYRFKNQLKPNVLLLFNFSYEEIMAWVAEEYAGIVSINAIFHFTLHECNQYEIIWHKC